MTISQAFLAALTIMAGLIITALIMRLFAQSIGGIVMEEDPRKAAKEAVKAIPTAIVLMALLIYLLSLIFG